MRPRIGVLTTWDARTPVFASGTAYYMARALERHCGEVVFLGPVLAWRDLIGRVAARMRRVFGLSYRPRLHGLGLAREYARIFQRRLPPDLDVIYAPWGSTQIAFLDTPIPIIYSTDGTYRLSRDYAPGFTNRSDAYHDEADEIERRAIERARLFLFPSTWVAQSAVEHYGATPANVHVTPWGANLDLIPKLDEIESTKPTDRCRLVFLGREWERKGGPTAYQAVLELRRRGLDATLTVCGCSPSGPYDPRALEIVAPVDKRSLSDRERLKALLLGANFLLQPTRQEMVGIAYCEASAHGTPSIATDTGGVSSVVTPGENGYLLPLEADGSAYADLIMEVFGDRARYRALVASSRRAYETRLNWDTWAQQVCDPITRAL